MEIAEGELTWTGLDELRPMLLGYLSRRCRDKSEADDLLQETLLRAARYRTSLLDERSLRAWVLRIARNVIADHARREHRLPPVASSEDLLDSVECPAPEPEPDDAEAELRFGNWIVAKREALACLAGAVLGLGEEDRRVLDSFYGGAGSCRETARECSIPPDLVKVRLYRARQRLVRAIRHRLSTGTARSCVAEEA